MAPFLPHRAQTGVKSEVGSAHWEVFVVHWALEEARTARIAIGANLAAGAEVTPDIAASRALRLTAAVGRAQRIRRTLALGHGSGERGRRCPPHQIFAC